MSQKKATSFRVVKLGGKSDVASEALEEPVLVSFPYNMPPASQLAQMKFNLYEELKQSTAAPRLRKRVLKSAYKALKYEASSLNADIKPKSQTSDYYIGVMDTTKNKCYALPIEAAYQMT